MSITRKAGPHPEALASLGREDLSVTRFTWEACQTTDPTSSQSSGPGLSHKGPMTVTHGHTLHWGGVM